MAHQPVLESLYQDGPAVYKAISVLLVLATVLYLHSRSAVKDVSRFPLIGQNVGGFSKRRRYFVNHALELFSEGYLKVPFNVEHHISILLIILSLKTLCGVSLQQMVGNMMTFPHSGPVLTSHRRGASASSSLRRGTSRTTRGCC